MSAIRRGWLVWLVCIAGTGGCDDITLNLEPSPQRTVRPAPEPIAAGRTAGPRGAATQPAEPVTVEPSYYQLVLTQDAVRAESPCGLTYVQLRCAPPRPLAGLLAMLYPPTGSSGSHTRHTLIYPTQMECDAAAARVGELDQPAAEDELSGATAAGGLGCAAGLWYRVYDQPRDRSRFRPVVEQLLRTADDPATARIQRWAARMLAAGILAERLAEPGRAIKLYRRAAGDAVPGSLEHLSALYAEGRTLFQAGQMQQARRVLEMIVGQFGALRDTEPFERARRLLGELQARG